MSSRSHKTIVTITVLAITFLLIPDFAQAAGAGGNMPWNVGLNTFAQSIIALGFTLIVLGLFVLGAMLVFSHEWGRFAGSIVLIIVAGGLMVGGTTIATALGVTGAVV